MSEAAVPASVTADAEGYDALEPTYLHAVDPKHREFRFAPPLIWCVTEVECDNLNQEMVVIVVHFNSSIIDCSVLGRLFAHLL